MPLINIPNKSPGDTAFSEEANQITKAVLSLQSEKGWGLYSDTVFTELSPQMFSGGVWSPISVNAGFKIETYLPLTPDGQTPTPLYDGGKMTPPSIGASFSAALSFIAKSDNTNGTFDVGIDIGGSVGLIFINSHVFPKGSGQYHEFDLSLNGFFLDTFFTNGGVVKLKPKTGQTVELYSASFLISINSQNQQ